MHKNHLKQLRLASRILSCNGHDDFNQGQISTRIPNTDEFYVKRAVSGFDNAELTDFVKCPIDFDAALSKDAPPETPLHQAIYKARPDVGGIVHSHPDYATVFGASDLEIKPLSHEGAMFCGQTGRYDFTTQTILDHQSASDVAEALGDKTAVFLCNHGIVIAGKNTRQATILAVLLERACKLQIIAESTGRKYQVSQSYEIAPKREFIYSDVALREYWRHASGVAKRTFGENL